jgi:hypothetical protein
MCGETMQFTEAERIERLPGTTEAHPQRVREWKCPECGYFEDANEEEN